jgi:hypothetical protein
MLVPNRLENPQAPPPPPVGSELSVLPVTSIVDWLPGAQMTTLQLGQAIMVEFVISTLTLLPHGGMRQISKSPLVVGATMVASRISTFAPSPSVISHSPVRLAVPPMISSETGTEIWPPPA